MAGKPFVVQMLNSTFGARGQIGFRSQFVKAELDCLGIANRVIARDVALRVAGAERALPLGQLVPRVLNAYRMLVRPSFDNRAYDTRLFEHFALPRFERAVRAAGGAPLLLHTWEFSPRLVDRASELGARIVVDVPIAPSHEVLRLMQAGMSSEISVPRANEREDYVIARADLLLAPSTYVANVLTRMGVAARRIAVIPFGCVLRAPKPPRSPSAKGITFLFAGTLSRRKGLRFLLEAWADPAFAGDRLVLCGRVTRAARELLAAAPAGNIETPGHVDVGRYLDAADVFVLPTLMEGSSKAVYEAMGAGLPVITTPNSGTVAEHGREAMLVEAGDAKALALAMRQLKEDAGLRERLGAAARDKAAEFTWERYARGVVCAYDEDVS